MITSVGGAQAFVLTSSPDDSFVHGTLRCLINVKTYSHVSIQISPYSTIKIIGEEYEKDT